MKGNLLVMASNLIAMASNLITKLLYCVCWVPALLIFIFVFLPQHSLPTGSREAVARRRPVQAKCHMSLTCRVQMQTHMALHHPLQTRTVMIRNVCEAFELWAGELDG